jgi:Pyruvate/2-oxoacid:ferredoxin oxidoreductase gamma subunit
MIEPWLLETPEAKNPRSLEAQAPELKSRKGIRLDVEMSAEDLEELINKFKAKVKEDLKLKNRLAAVDATKIAMEVLGLPITNTTMLGSLIKAWEIVKRDSFLDPQASTTRW